jgi:hypothetical protein
VNQENTASDADAQKFRDSYREVLHGRHLAWQLKVAGLVIGCVGVVISSLMLVHVLRERRNTHRVASAVSE